jgi:hypothetical protein
LAPDEARSDAAFEGMLRSVLELGGETAGRAGVFSPNPYGKDVRRIGLSRCGAVAR